MMDIVHHHNLEIWVQRATPMPCQKCQQIPFVLLTGVHHLSHSSHSKLGENTPQGFEYGSTRRLRMSVRYKESLLSFVSTAAKGNLIIHVFSESVSRHTAYEGVLRFGRRCHHFLLRSDQYRLYHAKPKMDPSISSVMFIKTILLIGNSAIYFFAFFFYFLTFLCVWH
jgi:hypothetical protein